MARSVAVLVVVCALALWVVPAVRADATFTGASGSLSASVTFAVTNDVLTVTLTNTSGVAALHPADLLTAVFFDLPGSATLTPVSAMLNPATGAGTPSGPTEVINPTTCMPPNPNCAGPNVSGEFAYRQGALAGVSQHYGLGSSGLGVFGTEDLFDSSFNLDDPLSPDGVNYGLLPTAGRGAGANAKLYAEPLIQNSVVMELRGVPLNFDPNAISNVRFQYGTSLAEPSLGGTITPITAVPEPASMVLLGSGLLVPFLRRTRRK